MMELLKKHIHMNRRRGNVTSQMTLDDDFNVPDSMDDVEELIMENGEVKIESVKNPGEKAEISGKLEFRILYRRPGGELTALAGSIPFTETVHMPGLAENDYVQAGWELDDLNVSLINSRKLNVKALVTLELKADEIRDMETASDVKFDGEVEVLKKTLTVAPSPFGGGTRSGCGKSLRSLETTRTRRRFCGRICGFRMWRRSPSTGRSISAAIFWYLQSTLRAAGRCRCSVSRRLCRFPGMWSSQNLRRT